MNHKNHFIAFAFVFVSSIYSNAQIDKGTWMLGGNFSGSSYKNENSDTNSRYMNNNTSFSIAPQAGYFVTKNILVGASIGYTYANSISENNYNQKPNYISTTHLNSTSKTQNLQFGILSAIYAPLNERIYFNSYLKMDFRTPLYGASQSSQTLSNGVEYSSSTDNSKLKGGVFSASIEPGITFFATSKLALEANLAILSFSNGSSYDSYRQATTSHSGFNFGINSVSVGIRYFIPKKA